jgi:hypothetical protein
VGEIRACDGATFGARRQFVAQKGIEQIEVREFALGRTPEMLIEAFFGRGQLERFQLATDSVKQQFGHIATSS